MKKNEFTPPSEMSPAAGDIIVKGARVHNLKDLDLRLPRRSLVVVTGPSGSGKSSLAFDTLYAEGQRRYIESLSSYAHQFLDQLPKPDVDRIEGLSPALAIDQKGLGSSPRSTVGTLTEIAGFMRLLFARCGTAVCPDCGIEASGRPLADIRDEIAGSPDGARLYLMAPVVRGRKGGHRQLLESLRQQGYLRVVIDGKMRELEEDIRLKQGSNHDISVLVDGFINRPGIDERLTAALERATEMADGSVVLRCNDQETYFSSQTSCAGCGRGFPEPDPRLFSFNSPMGSCPECNGLGLLRTISEDDLVTDPDLSLADGAVDFLKGRETSWLYTRIEALVGALQLDMDTPWRNIGRTERDVLLTGLDAGGDERLREHVHYNAFLKGWLGLVEEMVSLHRETRSERIRASIARLMTSDRCPACNGYRLKPEALCVRVGGLHIGEVCELSLVEAAAWADSVPLRSERDRAVGTSLLDQITARLGFLNQVGVEYLNLSRSAASLSGGEGQRVRLATQVGSKLRGVLYILDEPSIGLHSRDIHRLTDTLRVLRDRGNSIVVVEHDREVMLAADHIVDLGPGAGEHGGLVVAEGTVAEVSATDGSATGDYLAGRTGRPRVAPTSGGAVPEHWMKMTGLRGRNLRGIDLEIPLGRLTVVSGVSGSGKSTAIHDTLHRALAAGLHGAHARPEPFEKLEGAESVKSVVLVDQSPIGRSSRSTPATYTGLFDHVRKLFASTTLARMRGYKAGRFSFNTPSGRCPECEGAGRRRLTMDFLPDVDIVCEICGGARFDRETLEVHFKGCNIARILDLTVSEALEILENIPACRRILEVMDGVGLGYLRLGQSGATLSGGEAQRVKLAKELARGGRQHTLYILDEPTTGLHFNDVDCLLNVLKQLVDSDNTVVVIEHNADVILRADHVIDLGPEGGGGGGRVVAQGGHDAIMAASESHTGRMLTDLIN